MEQITNFIENITTAQLMDIIIDLRLRIIVLVRVKIYDEMREIKFMVRGLIKERTFGEYSW